MTPTRRRILLIDRKVQGALLVRTTIYWFYCLLSITLIAACWIVFTTTPTSSGEMFNRLWMNCGPVLLASVLLLPLVWMDCLRLSNRFAGPMMRIQRELKQLAHGATAREVHLRDKDFWHEMDSDLNEVIRRMDTAGLCRPSSEECRPPIAAGAADEQWAGSAALVAPEQVSHWPGLGQDAGAV
jgi:hypothetical protein